MHISSDSNYYIGLKKWSEHTLLDWCFTALQHKIGQFVPNANLPGGITGSGV